MRSLPRKAPFVAFVCALTLTCTALIIIVAHRHPLIAAGHDNPAAAPAAPASPVSPTRVSAARLPLVFEPAAGGGDRFVAQGNGYSFALRGGQVDIRLRHAEQHGSFAFAFVGARHVAAVADSPQPGHANYFIGRDSRSWRTNVPTFGRVRYADLYDGIDAVFYGNGRQLEYDLVVHPGADPRRARLAFERVDAMRIDDSGDLILTVAGRDVRQQKPHAYQLAGGTQRTVAAEYVLAGNQVAFALGEYDRAQPLIIDPVLVYSTYFGGSDHEMPWDVTVDATGATYVTGDTLSADFPATNTSINSNGNTGWQAFVLKLDRDGRVIYATIVGGSENEHSESIAVDPQGNAYVLGMTSSIDFPTTPGAFQVLSRGQQDAYVFKLAPRGDRLVYSTYYGGSGIEPEQFGGIAVDTSGNAYIASATTSTDLPVTSGAVYKTNTANNEEGFVAKFNATGTALVYSTYLAGGFVQPRAMALDNKNRPVVTGTVLYSMPTTRQYGPLGQWDAFVLQLNETFSAVNYSTRIGGADDDIAYDVALDLLGGPHITGRTRSATFPTQPDYVYQPTMKGPSDAFVAGFGPGGNVSYATFLGGSGTDDGASIQVTGNVITVAGDTSSNDFPVRDALQSVPGGNTDAFVARLYAGLNLVFGTYVGGSSNDFGEAIAVDGAGAITLVGYTTSTNFPTKNAAQPAISTTTGWESFITRFSMLPRGTAGPSDVVVNVADVATVHGNWIKESDSTAAGGAKLHNPDAGLAKVTTPQASPTDYFEFTVNGLFDGPYRVWVRARADNNSYSNDSVYVQFSNAWRGVEETPPLDPIGSTEAMTVVLEDCLNCGVHGWGWNDDAYGRTFATDLYFPPDAPVTVRVQRREDGISIDQIVFAREDTTGNLEPYYWSAPGYQKDDNTILPSTGGGRRASDVVLWPASDTTMTTHGTWTTETDATAAGGKKLRNPDAGAAKVVYPLASPANYFDVTFNVTSGVPYRLWIRGRADANSYNNDSAFVQFSGSVTSSGSAVWRIGTTSATTYVLENCSGCGVHGWGWQDNGYGTGVFGPVVYFAESGPQTIRVQAREDGLAIDQIVLSPQSFTYLNSTPGQTKDDNTIVPRTQ